MNGGETAFTNLYSRSLFQACVLNNKSCNNLYLDVSFAFASMLRQSIMNVEKGDAAWIDFMRQHGFSEPDITAIRNMVGHLASWNIDKDGVIIGPSGNDQDAAIDLTTRLVNEWFSNTQMSQEGIDKVIVTWMGCMAGTPLADLIFTLSVRAYCSR